MAGSLSGKLSVQPLSMLTFAATVKSGRNLSRIGEAQPSVMFPSIQNDVVKSSIALFLAELLTFALRESGKDDSLYTFLDRSFTLFDNLIKTYERATADEENVRGVDSQAFLVGVFSTALRGYVRRRAFDNLQKRLLYAFA